MEGLVSLIYYYFIFIFIIINNYYFYFIVIRYFLLNPIVISIFTIIFNLNTFELLAMVLFIIKSAYEFLQLATSYLSRCIRNFPWTLRLLIILNWKKRPTVWPWRNSDLAPFDIFSNSMQKGDPVQLQDETSRDCKRQ